MGYLTIVFWFEKQSLMADLVSHINPLLHRPILGSSNSAANKDRMSNKWTNGDTSF